MHSKSLSNFQLNDINFIEFLFNYQTVPLELFGLKIYSLITLNRRIVTIKSCVYLQSINSCFLCTKFFLSLSESSLVPLSIIQKKCTPTILLSLPGLESCSFDLETFITEFRLKSIANFSKYSQNSHSNHSMINLPWRKVFSFTMKLSFTALWLVCLCTK